MYDSRLIFQTIDNNFDSPFFCVHEKFSRSDGCIRGDYTNLNALSFFFLSLFSMYLPGAHARSPNKTLKTKLTHYHLTR